MTSYPLSDDQITAFRADGAICLRQVFDPAQVAALRRLVEEAIARPGPFAQDFSSAGEGGFFADLFVWTRVPALQDLVISPRLGEIAARLMGARQARFFFDHLLVKEPGSIEPTPWHQDAPYWPIDGRQCCSIWIAMDVVTRETGLVEYVRGSHATGKLYAPKSFHGDDRLADPDLSELPDIDAHRDDFEIISWDLAPGDVAVHDYRTVHGAPGNLALNDRRRRLATRWMGEDIVYRNRAGVPMPLRESMHALAANLADGEPLDHPIYPLVWEAGRP